MPDPLGGFEQEARGYLWQGFVDRRCSHHVCIWSMFGLVGVSMLRFELMGVSGQMAVGCLVEEFTDAILTRVPCSEYHQP